MSAEISSYARKVAGEMGTDMLDLLNKVPVDGFTFRASSAEGRSVMTLRRRGLVRTTRPGRKGTFKAYRTSFGNEVLCAA